jgi:Tfp pilus assembly protein PilF
MVLDPRNVPAWTNLGAVRLDRGDLNGAEEVYREALRIQPRHVDTLISYGGLLNIQGTRLEEQGQAEEAAKRYRNAETLLRRAASLAPESPVPRVNLGLCLQYQQRWDDAAAQYHRALALGPDNVQALHNLGSLHVRRGRPREAIAPLERALSLSPGQQLTRVLLAKALAEEQDFDRALRELANVLKAEPDFEPALTLRDDIRRRRATE